MHSRLAIVIAALCAGSYAGVVVAQQIVYPAKGQTAEQQRNDEGECGKWATSQTGFDPAKPPPATAAAPSKPQTATGTTAGAGARGAARGAVVGGMMGDAGAGAAAGAVAARGQSRRDNRDTAAQQQASQQQAQSSQQATYAKARAACLEGRGYTVK